MENPPEAVKLRKRILRAGEINEKTNEFATKAMKRKRKGKDRGIVGLMMIMHHFFKELPVWIEEMTDPRHQSYIIYSQSDLFIWG